jgi:hypothetical protein
LLQYASFTLGESSELDSALTQAEDDTGGRVRLVAGVFAPGYPESKKGGPSIPDVAELRSRVDLARYAASPEATNPGSRVEVFSHLTAVRILRRLRELREFQRGLADYQRFTQIGIQGADLDNSAGLLASAMREFTVAEALYLRAADKAPTEIVYRLNALTMQVTLENMEVAARTADAIDQATFEKRYKHFIFGTACLALALAHRAIDSGAASDLTRAQLWVTRALELDTSAPTKARLQASQDRLNALIEAGRTE